LLRRMYNSAQSTSTKPATATGISRSPGLIAPPF
jgi:hypothetical protein